MKTTTTNCGHTIDYAPACDYYGYRWCDDCIIEDTVHGLRYCNRASVCIDDTDIRDMGVYDLTGNPIGEIVDRVIRSNAKTPTGGKYRSDRMTVVDTLFDNKWYANGPKDASGVIVLRKAE